jgi:ubiquinone/menaquinone biosynthesis C-methylase UbiE
MALAGLLDERWVVGDLACGTGQISAAVAGFVHRVVAVDRSRAMLKAARQRLGSLANVDIRQGELEALPVDDRELDAAAICLALHHVSEPRAAVAEAARTLRPGGRLLVIDMLEHDRREYQQEMGHVWLGFAPTQIAGWLGAAGFEAVRVQPLPPAPQAAGPALFAATGRRPSDQRH